MRLIRDPKKLTALGQMGQEQVRRSATSSRSGSATKTSTDPSSRFRADVAGSEGTLRGEAQQIVPMAFQGLLRPHFRFSGYLADAGSLCTAAPLAHGVALPRTVWGLAACGCHEPARLLPPRSPALPAPAASHLVGSAACWTWLWACS